MIDKLFKAIYARLDNYSLVVQANGDTGDSAYRSGIFAFLLRVLNHPQAQAYYEVMIHNLTVSPGILHRSDNPNSWAYNWNNFSRDQASAVMLAAAVNNDGLLQSDFYYQMRHRKELETVPKYGKYLKMINWFLPLHQNINSGGTNVAQMPDIIGIDEISNQIRRKNMWYLYPLLTLLDFQFLISMAFFNSNTWDQDSLLLKNLIYAQLVMPTITSFIAKKFYARGKYKERIARNYADSANGVEPLGELYILAGRIFIENDKIKDLT